MTIRECLDWAMDWLRSILRKKELPKTTGPKLEIKVVYDSKWEQNDDDNI